MHLKQPQPWSGLEYILGLNTTVQLDIWASWLETSQIGMVYYGPGQEGSTAGD